MYINQLNLFKIDPIKKKEIIGNESEIEGSIETAFAKRKIPLQNDFSKFVEFESTNYN